MEIGASRQWFLISGTLEPSRSPAHGLDPTSRMEFQHRWVPHASSLLHLHHAPHACTTHDNLAEDLPALPAVLSFLPQQSRLPNPLLFLDFQTTTFKPTSRPSGIRVSPGRDSQGRPNWTPVWVPLLLVPHPSCSSQPVAGLTVLRLPGDRIPCSLRLKSMLA